MRALRKPAPGPKLIRADIEKPEPGPGEVLVRVTHAGICGTDVHIWKWDAWAAGRLKPPLTTGHEFVGIVEKAGEGVDGIRPGDRVSAEGHITCGVCRYCRTGQGHICSNVKIIGVDCDGCFADYLVMPASNIWPVDRRIPDHHAAIFDPLGNAMHTVATEPVAGKTVLIVGAGAIGLFAIPICKAFGADRVIVAEPNAYRRKLAQRVKADLILDPTKNRISEVVHRDVDPDGVDVMLEMSGHPEGFREGLRSLRGAGAAVLLGLPAEPFAIDWSVDIIFKAIRIFGVNGRRMFDTWYQSQQFFIAHGASIEPILTHQMPLEDFEKGFDLLLAGKAGKIILNIAGGSQ
ncbi:L-threonine 3-dehydrogenase [Candidatus Poribacteria bacterium]|nr:L-threonine 3-dehydrogenase [Candidatus Poribacteria bacterium]